MPKKEIPPPPQDTEPPSKAPLVIKLFPSEAQQVREALVAYPGIRMDEVVINPNDRSAGLPSYKFTGNRRIINQLIANPSALKGT